MFGGCKHIITTDPKNKSIVHCLDTTQFSAIMTTTGPCVLNPPLVFILRFNLADDGTEILKSDIRYDISELNSVPLSLRAGVTKAVEKMEDLET